MIFDTAEPVTRHLPALKRLGVTAIIRYLTTNLSGSKLLKSAEAHAISNAGMKIGLVFEVWGGSDNFSHNDIHAANGDKHARFCNGYLKNTLQAPPSVVVYFAIDTDCTAGQVTRNVIPYFSAIKAARLGYHIGVYGPGICCERLLMAGLIEKAWLANATGWNGYSAFKASKRWSILQRLPRRVDGLDVDPDELEADAETNPGHDPGFYNYVA